MIKVILVCVIMVISFGVTTQELDDLMERIVPSTRISYSVSMLNNLIAKEKAPNEKKRLEDILYDIKYYHMSGRSICLINKLKTDINKHYNAKRFGY